MAEKLTAPTSAEVARKMVRAVTDGGTSAAQMEQLLASAIESDRARRDDMWRAVVEEKQAQIDELESKLILKRGNKWVYRTDDPQMPYAGFPDTVAAQWDELLADRDTLKTANGQLLSDGLRLKHENEGLKARCAELQADCDESKEDADRLRQERLGLIAERDALEAKCVRLQEYDRDVRVGQLRTADEAREKAETKLAKLLRPGKELARDYWDAEERAEKAEARCAELEAQEKASVIAFAMERERHCAQHARAEKAEAEVARLQKAVDAAQHIARSNGALWIENKRLREALGSISARGCDADWDDYDECPPHLELCEVCSPCLAERALRPAPQVDGEPTAKASSASSPLQALDEKTEVTGSPSPSPAVLSEEQVKDFIAINGARHLSKLGSLDLAYSNEELRRQLAERIAEHQYATAAYISALEERDQALAELAEANRIAASAQKWCEQAGDLEADFKEARRLLEEERALHEQLNGCQKDRCHWCELVAAFLAAKGEAL